MVKCIGCGEEVILGGLEVSGWGWAHGIPCYKLFIKGREKWLAREVWGDQAKV